MLLLYFFNFSYSVGLGGRHRKVYKPTFQRTFPHSHHRYTYGKSRGRFSFLQMSMFSAPLPPPTKGIQGKYKTVLKMQNACVFVYCSYNTQRYTDQWSRSSEGHTQGRERSKSPLMGLVYFMGGLWKRLTENPKPRQASLSDHSQIILRSLSDPDDWVCWWNVTVCCQGTNKHAKKRI